MQIGARLVKASVDHPRAVTAVVVAVTVLIALMAGLPSLAPRLFRPLHPIRVDTDPENMLSGDEPVRVFHDRMKRALELHDMVVVGVVNEADPAGVFNPTSLAKVYELTEFARTLQWTDENGEKAGVVEVDIIAPSMVDNIQPVPGQNKIRFSWLMPRPPESAEAARQVLTDAQRIPFFRGTMVPPTPGDGKAVCLYLPITSKDVSYAVYSKLRKEVARLGGPDEYHITGLPVAEDTFGVEMFVQMAISAPAAMLVIFLLLLAFFRKLVVIVSPLIVAVVSVVVTMGALVVSGFPIHIMSSMIPIFIMPIAVLDSVHIISEFFERYQATRDRRQTMVSVMGALFMPMLYTSLTSAAGFASLALTPIPPVQVFGVFVAAGIMAAWLLTVTFIPAYVMFIRPGTLENFGAARTAGEGGRAGRSPLGWFLRALGGATYRWAKPILALGLLVLAAAAFGITRININDNPIKWFTPSHPIRVADRVLNRHFGGTYMAYLALESDEPAFQAEQAGADLAARARARAEGIAGQIERLAPAGRAVAARAKSIEGFFDLLVARLRPDFDEVDDERLAQWLAVKEFLDRSWDPLADAPAGFDAAGYADGLAARARMYAQRAGLLFAAIAKCADGCAELGPKTRGEFLDAVAGRAADARKAAPDDEVSDAAWAAAAGFLSQQRQLTEVFKRPDVLAHMKRIQAELKQTGIVGKSNSLVEIVETVNRDLHDGKGEYERIPANRKGVAECITQFESGHRPRDLTHFVTTADYRTASIWVQLKSGDNRDMAAVARRLEAFLDSPAGRVAGLPPLRHNWFGLTYINVVWQDKMVWGMLQAFLGSFLVVFLLMTVLFRSALWGLLSMIPLTVTIAAIYGAVGLLGKDYDMPVAVLSALTLGLAVDFAIHFLARGRAMFAAHGSWERTVPAVFGEPARAIARNIIVIAAGFLPLLLAPLVPYRTVGMLMATILLVSGAATLLLLPALVRVLARRLFVPGEAMGPGCNCVLCIVSAIALVALVALALHQYWKASLGWTTVLALAAVPLLAGACGILSRREKCKQQPEIQEDSDE